MGRNLTDLGHITRASPLRGRRATFLRAVDQYFYSSVVRAETIHYRLCMNVEKVGQHFSSYCYCVLYYAQQVFVFLFDDPLCLFSSCSNTVSLAACGLSAPEKGAGFDHPAPNLLSPQFWQYMSFACLVCQISFWPLLVASFCIQRFCTLLQVHEISLWFPEVRLEGLIRLNCYPFSA